MSESNQPTMTDIEKRARMVVRSTFTSRELCRMVDKRGTEATVGAILDVEGNSLFAEKSDGDAAQAVQTVVDEIVTKWSDKSDARSYPRPPTSVGNRISEKDGKATSRSRAGRSVIESASDLPRPVILEIREAVQTIERGRSVDTTRSDIEAAVDFLDSAPVPQDEVDALYEEIGLADVLGPSGPNVEPTAREMRRSVDAPNPSVTKQYELRRGLMWTEQVTVREVRRDEGTVVMQEELVGSTWEETVEMVEASLRELEEREHDWLYHLVAGEYPNLTAESVHEMLHNRAGLPTHAITDKQDPTEVADRKAAEDGYTLREGLSWTQGVMVLTDSPERGTVTMKDTLTGTVWTEPREKIQEKLDILEQENHEWLYELVSGEYPTLDVQDAHTALHRAAGVETGDYGPMTRAGTDTVDSPSVSDTGETPTIIVAEKAAIPDGAIVRERDDGMYEYEVR